MKLPKIPQYLAEVRHPDLGWHVTSVHSTQVVAERHFNDQVRAYPDLSWSVKICFWSMDGQNEAQVWGVLHYHEGKHDYRNGRG